MPTAEREYLLEPLAAAVDARAQRLDRRGFSARLYSGDPELWGADPTARELVAARLGWLELPGAMRAVRWPSRHAGDVLLIGIGGSSLAARACSMAFGTDALRVIDSTVPEAVIGVVDATELAGAAVIVASKSGTTLETEVLAEWFLRTAAHQGAAVELVAITDAGTVLQERVEAMGGRVWCNRPDVGGRFSALSYFGLVPAALAGVPVATLVDRAVAAESRRTSSSDPSVRLGIILAEAFNVGRDKITFVTAPRLTGFADWAEQLIAESTGKQGTGLVPVTREPPLDGALYGSDRLFVVVDDESENDDRTCLIGEKLVAAGHPVIRHTLSDPADLGAEFLRWEVAVATAGALMGINPFDEPDVAAAKARTHRMLEDVQEGSHLPDPVAAFEDEHASFYLSGEQRHGFGPDSDALGAWLTQRCGEASEGYCALLAFLPVGEHIAALLDETRALVTERFGVATTLGWGPRYLHSTGQLHKGGPPNGVYILLTADDAEDLDIPGRGYTLGTVAGAQALGDMEALRERQRPVMRIHLHAPITESFEIVVDSLRRGADVR